MKLTLEQYHSMIKTRSIGFIGVGVSHRELIRQYAAAGARLTVRDRRSLEELGDFGRELTQMGVRLMLGADYLRDITEEVLFRAPLLPVIDQVKPEDAAVVELSSFQLISMRRSPDTALITNVAPNHLDMHKDMQEYVDAKKNLYRHQDAFSRTVLNWDNDITRSMAEEVRGDLYWFSRRETVSRGTYLDTDGVLHHIDETGDVALFPMQEIRIPGMHNVENFLGVIAALWGEVSPELFRTVAREFAGVEHRIEFVRELDGVKWYNDSIASNPTRTIAGLMSFNQKLCIIAGGYDKKIPFQPLADPVAERVKLLILTGPTADKIEAAVKASPKYDPAQCRILRAKDLPEAVALARQETVPGDIVSLSPACASFDAYPNFEVRGQHFKELVRALS